MRLRHSSRARPCPEGLPPPAGSRHHRASLRPRVPASTPIPQSFCDDTLHSCQGRRAGRDDWVEGRRVGDSAYLTSAWVQIQQRMVILHNVHFCMKRVLGLFLGGRSSLSISAHPDTRYDHFSSTRFYCVSKATCTLLLIAMATVDWTCSSHRFLYFASWSTCLTLV